MSTQDPADESSDVECPTCGRDDFGSRQGMKVHHKRKHGESIAGTTLICEWCGDEKTIRPTKAEGRRFCSKSCYSKWQSENWVGDGHPSSYDGGKVECQCELCGETYYKKRCKASYSRYCSRDCLAEYRSQYWTGQNAPAWKGGYQPYYGSNWKRQRDRARETADHACEACGKDEDELHRQLDVHHIHPVRSFEDRTEANTLENLIALCPDCHVEWEGIPLRPQ